MRIEERRAGAAGQICLMRSSPTPYVYAEPSPSRPRRMKLLMRSYREKGGCGRYRCCGCRAAEPVLQGAAPLRATDDSVEHSVHRRMLYVLHLNTRTQEKANSVSCAYDAGCLFANSTGQHSMCRRINARAWLQAVASRVNMAVVHAQLKLALAG